MISGGSCDTEDWSNDAESEQVSWCVCVCVCPEFNFQSKQKYVMVNFSLEVKLNVLKTTSLITIAEKSQYVKNSQRVNKGSKSQPVNHTYLGH